MTAEVDPLQQALFDELVESCENRATDSQNTNDDRFGDEQGDEV